MMQVTLQDPTIYTDIKVGKAIFPLRDYMQITDASGNDVPILEVERSSSGELSAIVSARYVGQTLTVKERRRESFYKRDGVVTDKDMLNALVENARGIRADFEQDYNYSIFSAGEIRIWQTPSFSWKAFEYFEDQTDAQKATLRNIITLTTFELSTGHFPLEEGFDYVVRNKLLFIIHKNEIESGKFTFTANATGTQKITIGNLICDIYYWDKVPANLRVGYAR